ncbi:MAG TPA: hypothetical protein VIP11_11330, partial [Gemmatimonadaceae bacterium]
MTLMELVIGLAITGLMATAGARAFTSIIDHRATVRDANLTTERAAALREMIRSWGLNGNIRIVLSSGPRGLTRTLGNTFPPAAVRPTGNVVQVTPAKNSGDDVTIVTSAPNPAMVPNLAIRLYIDADETTRETGLTMEYQANPQTPLVRRMLDSTISAIVLEYLDGRTGRWMPSSQAATIGNMRAVRFSFVPSDTLKGSPLLGIPLTFLTGVAVTGRQ